MNKTDYSILLFLSLLIAFLVGFNLWLGMSNTKLNNEMLVQQETINRARQLEQVLDNLAKRIAQGSEADPRLLDILKNNSLQVTIDSDGEKKSYP